jgi:hypothetical protein
MSSSPRAHAPSPDALSGPFRRVLRPLVRLLIRSGVTFPVFAELLRGLYVEVAAHDLLPEAERTDSRISLLTGVHRKEIRRLREQADTPEPEPERVTLASAIIARWLKEHAGADGVPLPLPRVAAEGASFEALVRGVTRDVRPRAVLDDWLGQQIVTLDEVGRVRLNLGAFVPRPGAAEQLFYFGRNLHDHAAAAAANLLASGTAPFLERSAHYDGLTAETAAEIDRLGRVAAQRMLEEVNRAALDLLGANDAAVARGPAGPLLRVNIGTYVFCAEDERKGQT